MSDAQKDLFCIRPFFVDIWGRVVHCAMLWLCYWGGPLLNLKVAVKGCKASGVTLKSFKKKIPLKTKFQCHIALYWTNYVLTKYLTGPYSLRCKQKMFKTFGICPIILWYLGYLKQEKTKKSSESPFREDRLKFFPYKSSRERKARITKWSLWRSGWSKKSH